MSRVFERVLIEDINFDLERNSLISDSQFGLRHKKSVELQLLNCYTKCKHLGYIFIRSLIVH